MIQSGIEGATSIAKFTRKRIFTNSIKVYAVLIRFKQDVAGNWKHALQLLALQILNYSICCFSYRMLAQANIRWSVGTDIVYSSLMYMLIRKVAQGDGNWVRQVGYVIGSAIGTYLGIVISLLVTGGK